VTGRDLRGEVHQVLQGVLDLVEFWLSGAQRGSRRQVDLVASTLLVRYAGDRCRPVVESDGVWAGMVEVAQSLIGVMVNAHDQGVVVWLRHCDSPLQGVQQALH